MTHRRGNIREILYELLEIDPKDTNLEVVEDKERIEAAIQELEALETSEWLQQSKPGTRGGEYHRK